MFTKNYWNILSSFALGGGADKILTKTNGTTYTLEGKHAVATPFGCTVTNILTKYNTGGVIFGDGTTPPTPDDYALSGNIVTGINGSRTRQGSIDELGHNNIFTFTLTNTNSTDVTIREVGFLYGTSLESRYLSSDSSTSLTQTTLNVSMPLLVNRIVLDEPITISAGGVGQVTVNLRFNYPTA